MFLMAINFNSYENIVSLGIIIYVQLQWFETIRYVIVQLNGDVIHYYSTNIIEFMLNFMMLLDFHTNIAKEKLL